MTPSQFPVSGTAGRVSTRPRSRAAMPGPVIDLRARLAAALARGEMELPVLPEMAAEVLSLCADPRSDARRLAETVRRDPALVAYILRVANSPVMGAAVAIKSLPQAISRLGMTQVRSIAVAIACKHKVFMARGFEEEVREQFTHSFAAALWAQEIARARRWNVEEAFLSGLLHDVGRPAVLQALVTMDPAARSGPQRALALTVADEQHAVVGAALARRWRLPMSLAETIAHHHDVTRALSVPAVAMTWLADDLARWLLDGTDPTGETVREHPMRVPLNLYGDELDGLLARGPLLRTMVEAIT